MASRNLPPEDHFVRHVSPGRLKRREDGTIYGCFPQAFEMRADEDELSGSWLEHFDGDRAKRLEATAAAMVACGLSIKPTAGFGVVNVADLHGAAAGFGVKLRVLHEPSKTNPNPAYASIRNLPRDNLELFVLMAEACADIVEAREVLPSKPAES